MTDRPTEAPSAAAEIRAVRELVGAQPDETTLQAVQDMMTERQHYVREANRAHEETIPMLQSRADGYALLVGELIGHLAHVIDAGTNGGGWAEWECRVCLATWFGAADAKPQIVHEPGCLLAADPEARAAELLQELHKNSASVVE